MGAEAWVYAGRDIKDYLSAEPDLYDYPNDRQQLFAECARPHFKFFWRQVEHKIEEAELDVLRRQVSNVIKSGARIVFLTREGWAKKLPILKANYRAVQINDADIFGNVEPVWRKIRLKLNNSKFDAVLVNLGLERGMIIPRLVQVYNAPAFDVSFLFFDGLPLTILTKPPRTLFNLPIYLWSQLKDWIRKTIFIFTRNPRFLGAVGPAAVLQSLERGLSELGVAYVVNPGRRRIGRVVHVLSNLPALRWAIRAKRRGEIDKLIAGPNLVVAPDEENGILFSSEIDIVLLNSEWTKNFYSSFGRDLACKIKIWAVGVFPKICRGKEKKDMIIVFKKSAPDNIFKTVLAELKKRNLSHIILEYGRYLRSEYKRLLNRSRFMIYLSEHESQGIAIQEAWMCGVPTLVWESGCMRWGEYEWRDEKVSVPYLTPVCGRFFLDAEDFPEALDNFISDLPKFSPREYALRNFSDKVSAEKYLNILRSTYK